MKYTKESITKLLGGFEAIKQMEKQIRKVAKILEDSIWETGLMILKKETFGDLVITLNTSRKGNLITKIKKGQCAWTNRQPLPKEVVLELHRHLPEILNKIKSKHPEIGKEIDFFTKLG